MFLEDGEYNQQFVSHPKTPSQLGAYAIIHHTVWFAPLDFFVAVVLLLLVSAKPQRLGSMQRLLAHRYRPYLNNRQSGLFQDQSRSQSRQYA